MMANLSKTLERLQEAGQPFAVATVVRTLSVTAAKAGAKAVVLADGTISEGWVGGGCAKGAVAKAAREAIADGQPRLISLKPEDLLQDEGVSAGDERDGVRYVRNGCPSEGSMDIFIEPVLQQPELVVIGASPVAVALSNIAASVGFLCTICAPEGEIDKFSNFDRANEGFTPPQRNGMRFVVVATQGSGDAKALAAALECGASWISFVGSRRKMASMTEKFARDGFGGETLDAVKAPAGLDIKAVTPEEIALSILAELVMQRRQATHPEQDTK